MLQKRDESMKELNNSIEEFEMNINKEKIKNSGEPQPPLYMN